MLLAVSATRADLAARSRGAAGPARSGGSERRCGGGERPGPGQARRSRTAKGGAGRGIWAKGGGRRAALQSASLIQVLVPRACECVCSCVCSSERDFYFARSPLVRLPFFSLLPLPASSSPALLDFLSISPPLLSSLLLGRTLLIVLFPPAARPLGRSQILIIGSSEARRLRGPARPPPLPFAPRSSAPRLLAACSLCLCFCRPAEPSRPLSSICPPAGRPAWPRPARGSSSIAK